MSKTIDNRVVQLEFDNQEFEQNAQESLTTLQKLKQSLKLDDAAKNLTAIKLNVPIINEDEFLTLVTPPNEDIEPNYLMPAT